MEVQSSVSPFSQMLKERIIQPVTTSRLMAALLLAIVAVVFATAAPAAMAQTSTGQIKGVVTDPSGAVVPGATVTAISLDNGFTRTVTSGKDGSFLLPELDPQHYKVQVVAPTFKKLERGPITVRVTETADVGRIPLTIGEQTQIVTVEAQEELLNTESATLGKVFDAKSIEALPLSTRNFTQLIGLQAGVIGSIPSTLTFGNGTTQFAVGGNRVYDNSINIDGVNAVSAGASGSFSVPSPDALEEFKVQTGSYSAEYGRAGGASVDVTTKSGTNQFHGDGFYFFRNKALDANSYFGKQSDAILGMPNVPQDLRQNQWGGTIGGPIIRNKLTFFFSYQSTTQLNGNAGLVINDLYPLLPTGDRSNTVAFEQALGAIYGGETGLVSPTPFAADGSNISPVALALLQYKLPNGNYLLPSFPQQDILNTGRKDISYAAFTSLPKYTEKQYMGNVDYKISPRQTLTEKYFDSHTLVSSNNGTVPGFSSLSPGVSENTNLTHTFIITPSLINELKLGYLRQYGSGTVDNSGLTATGVGMLGAPGAGGAFPQMLNAQDGIFFPESAGSGVSAENQYSVSDVVSKTLSHHNIRFGIQALRHELNSNSIGAGALFTYQFADFLIGQPGNIFLSAASAGSFARNFRFYDFGYFVQDDFKVLPTLTLNLGLRWDLYQQPTEINGRMDNFVPSLIAEGAYGIPTGEQGYTGYTLSGRYHRLNPKFAIPGGVELTNDQDGLNTNYKNYAPRVGFAWSPERTLSVRGAFGIFFNRASSAVAQALVSGAPFNDSYLVVFPPDATLQDPFTSLNLPPESAFPIFQPRVYNPNAASGIIYNAAAQHVGNPYTEQWNLNIQQQFGRNLLFELAYQGSNGVKLLEALSQNQSGIASPTNPIRGITNNLSLGTPTPSGQTPTPANNGSLNVPDRAPVAGVGPDEELAVTGTTASSHFNALEVTVNERLNHGLQFLSAFTWSRTEDSDTVGTGGVGSAAVPPNDNNSTHHMSLSGNDRKLRFTTSAVYTVPNPIKNAHTFAEASINHALGGWGLAAVIVAQTGGPISFGISNDTAQSSAVKYDGNLTDSLLPGYRLSDLETHGPAKSRLNKYFNSAHDGTGTGDAVCATLPGAKLACPGPTEFGNLPTNTSIRNPGQKSVDLALTKTTKIFEGYSIEFRADFFNAFNWVNFGGPDAGITDATFGVIQSTTVDPRVIQISGKFKF